MSESLDTIVVVGAGLAGMRTAQALRKRGFEGRLSLVGAELHVPYDRPPLSKQLLLGQWPPEKLRLCGPGPLAALELDLVLGRSARALDVRARRLTLDDGAVLPYDGLVIATGGSPRALPQAAGFSGVFALRTLDDALALRAALLAGPRVAIVGAGFIGLEVAAACRTLGLEVSVVEPQPLPLLGLLGQGVAEAIRALHARHGVQFKLGVGVRACVGGCRLERLVLTDGSTLDCDVAVVGIGVVPDTAWLQGSGVALDDGVLCDASCATNVPGIVACGDVARWPNAFSGATARIEHWSNAVEQAQAAAARLLDGAEAARPYVHVPYFWSDQYDRKLQCAGRPGAQDAVAVVDGDLAGSNYVALFGRDDRLTCVLASSRPAAFLRYRRLLGEHASFSRACGAD